MGEGRIVAASEADYTRKSAQHIVNCILKFQSTRPGCFVVGFSGTNGHVRRSRAFDMLRSLGSADGVDWSRVVVFLVDERYGVERAEDSNADLLRRALVQAIEDKGATLPPENLVLPDVSIKPRSACAKDYELTLNKLFRLRGPPNLLTVGLAADLSVGSIFPEWYRGRDDRWQAAVARNFGVLETDTTHFEVSERIAINLRIILSAESIVVFLGGKAAGEMLRDSSGAEVLDFAIADSLDEASPRATCIESRSKFRPTPRSNLSRAVSTVERNCSELLMSEVGSLQGVLAPQDQFGLSRAQTAHAGRASEFDEAVGKARFPQMRREASESQCAAPASPLSYIMKYCFVTVVHLHEDNENHFSIVVFGAAGDLAKKKTIPAIFNLYMSRSLPTNFNLVCCDDLAYHADIKNTDDLWANRLEQYLKNEGSATDLTEFRQLLSFCPIELDNPEAMRKLDESLKELSDGFRDNRVFYLAQPPFLFEKSVRAIRQQCWSEPDGWVRVIVEKPFGRDLNSAKELDRKLAAFLDERQIYRIDHYLAKTMVLNVLTLRFANRELGRLFHADNVANVRITFKEDIGVDGRAGYFDNYGIIRDIMQNHLLQLLTLVTMEAPASLGAEDVRNEKVKVLKQIRPVEIDDCVIGQYEGYQDDPDIKKVNEKKGYRSKCPTFAVCVLYLDNERWSGVPLILKAGKNVEQRSTIMRLQFKKAPPNSLFGDQPQNELVMRVQPNEAIYYRVLAKTPGISARAHEVRRTVLDLDLRKLEVGRPPEAYEKLVHDVMKGEGHNFVRSDEVEEGWRIFDPLLKHLESKESADPAVYAKGSHGPREADELINSTGFRRYTKTGVQGLAEDRE